MRNPIRRSRKIGATQGGRVQNGRAYPKWSRVFIEDVWTRLSEDTVNGCRVLTENPSRDYYHPCSGDEPLSVLARLPSRCSEGVKAIVLRRVPKLDEALGIEARRRYACVILNAFPRSRQMVWQHPPTEAVRRHYSRWCRNWAEDLGKVVLCWSRNEIRQYYLYHLLLHEIGHINQPWRYSLRKREEYAENFALEWAERLGELPPSVEA